MRTRVISAIAVALLVIITGGGLWWRTRTSNPVRGALGTDNAISSSRKVKAFPTAEGFGAHTSGGRGGRICEVTNLHDSGAGSFRECAEAFGRRIVVFRTGGSITVSETITVRSPYVTIAGQTAPGGGITLTAQKDSPGALFAIRAHDVVIRHMRFRPGPSTAPSSERDGMIIMAGASNVILDHISVSWATDENVSITDGARNLTVQWSIISEGLRNSTHTDGAHSMGLLISHDNFESAEKTHNITLHHNLFAHNSDRNPTNVSAGLVDMVNNVIYNYGERAVDIRTDTDVRPLQNVVGNYFKASGDIQPYADEVNVTAAPGEEASVYLRDNLGPHETSEMFELPRLYDIQPEAYILEREDRRHVVTKRHPAPTVRTTSAREAYGMVLSWAGSRVPLVDAVDHRVIDDVRDGTGRIIDDPADVGGWPHLDEGTPLSDRDHDGMHDDWESLHELDPKEPSDGSEIAANGYTNVENYLNELAGDFRALGE
jgi:pectate lyase